MYDTIIIGGGPAGLTATMYAVRKRLNALLIAGDLGGKTNHHLALKDIDHYQLIQGVEIVNKFRQELEYLDFAYSIDTVRSVNRSNEHFELQTLAGKSLRTKTLIIATGARQKFLGVPGEKEHLGKGLGYSVMSYAPLFIDKDAVVIGDGSLALQSAAEMATVAAHVHLVTNVSGLVDSPLGLKLDRAGNVTIWENCEVKEVLGNGFCTGVRVEKNGEEFSLTADGTFVEKALIPNSEIVAGLVELDGSGRIMVDHRCRTNVPGLFAAGDVTTTTEQVLVALGEGAKAAISAYEYLLPTLRI